MNWTQALVILEIAVWIGVWTWLGFSIGKAVGRNRGYNEGWNRCAEFYRSVLQSAREIERATKARKVFGPDISGDAEGLFDRESLN